MDKCPKCGASKRIASYECGAYLYSKGDLWQSPYCRTHCELSALRTKHDRLVEAARRVSGKARIGTTGAWIGKEEFANMEKALESEANNG